MIEARRNFTEHQHRFLNDATEHAFAIVDKQYGRDNDHTGEHHLRFHNGHHARIVCMGSKALTEALGLSKEDIAVAAFAGAAHDMVQLQGKKINEQKSADWATERIGEVIPQGMAHMARLAILGTEPILNEHFIITDQRANLQEYPSKRAEQVAKAVASADLGSLYTPEGPLLGYELYREFNNFNNDQTPEIDERLVTFQRRQLQLLHNYQYPLKEANTMLATHRPEVEAYGANTLMRLEQGKIHSWKQLTNEAIAFRNRHS